MSMLFDEYNGFLGSGWVFEVTTHDVASKLRPRGVPRLTLDCWEPRFERGAAS